MREVARRSGGRPAGALPLLLVVLCCGSRCGFAQADPEPCPDRVRIDVPPLVAPGSETTIHLELGEGDSPTTVSFEPDPESYHLDRSTVTLKKGTPESIHLTMNKYPMGLVKLSMSIPPCKSFERPIDAGFSDSVTISVDSKGLVVASDHDEKPPAPIAAGSLQFFRLHLTDRLGRPVHLAAPIAVELRAVGDALLSKDTQSWSKVLEVQIKENTDQSEPAAMKTPTWTPDDGSIDATVKMDSSHVLATRTIRYSTRSPWWVFLLATILGAFLYSLLETLVERRLDTKWLRAEGLWKVCVALMVGILGYLFLETDWLGVKLESLSMRGHILFGVLIGCFGLEGIYKKLKSRVDKLQGHVEPGHTGKKGQS